MREGEGIGRGGRGREGGGIEGGRGRSMSLDEGRVFWRGLERFKRIEVIRRVGGARKLRLDGFF